MKKLIFMVILLAYEITLVVVRRKGINRFLADDVTDAIIKIIPIVMCVIGALE